MTAASEAFEDAETLGPVFDQEGGLLTGGEKPKILLAD